MEYRKFGDAYIVRLDRDEEILAQLKIFAEKEQVKLAVISATCELVVTCLPGETDRVFSDEVGLNLISF